MLRSRLARARRNANLALFGAAQISALAAMCDRAHAVDARVLVQQFAAPFTYHQLGDGAYATGPRVQTHLKSEMAMCLAAEVLADSSLASSARRDLEWVLRERLEPSGGLNWDGPDNPFFFEVHQHWFLIASQWVREANQLVDQYREEQAHTWGFLRASNPAARDFYVANLEDHGLFFAYRSVDRDGHFQTQAAFKGSYEIGAAVWALSLAAHSAATDTLAVLRSYRDQLVECVARSPEEGGFYDESSGGWIRALLFSPDGWHGFVPRDRKYSLHMLEGCLESERLEPNTTLHPLVRFGLSDLLMEVSSDGSIQHVPDGFGSAEYEYGVALSVLALGSDLYRWEDPAFSRELGGAALRVLEYVSRTFAGRSDEDHAVLLLGVARVAAFITAPGTPADTPGGTREALALRVWPNPTRGEVELSWHAFDAEAARVLVFDAAGRVRARLDSPQSFDLIRRAGWDGRDADGRLLPAGSYELSLQGATGRATSRVILLR